MARKEVVNYSLLGVIVLLLRMTTRTRSTVEHCGVFMTHVNASYETH
jgi:hypothetical protein